MMPRFAITLTVVLLSFRLSAAIDLEGLPNSCRDFTRYGQCANCGAGLSISLSSAADAFACPGYDATTLRGNFSCGRAYSIEYDFDYSGTKDVQVTLFDARNAEAISAVDAWHHMSTAYLQNGIIDWIVYSANLNGDTLGIFGVGTDVPLVPGQCYRVQFVYDGSAGSIYVNGQLYAGPVPFDLVGPQSASFAFCSSAPLPPSFDPLTLQYFRLLGMNLSINSSIGFNLTHFDITENPLLIAGSPTPGACVSPNLTPATPTFTPAPPPATSAPTATPVLTCPTGCCVSIYYCSSGDCYTLATCTPTQVPLDTPTQVANATVVLTATLTPTMTTTPLATMTPTPGDCGTACSNGVTRIGQGSPNPWASVQIDSTSNTRETIAYIGCFLTCYSMIDPKKRTPDELNTLFDDNGYFDDGGALSDPKDAANQIGFDYALRNVTGTAATELISNEVCSPNTYVVVQVRNSSHFVLVTGREYDPTTNTCRFTINDPAHTNHTFLDEYTIEDERPVATVRIFTKQ